MAAHRFSLARQYYAILALTLLTLGALSAASVEFARSTSDQARQIETKGLLLARLSAGVRLLAEQHRRLTEAVAGARDPGGAPALREELRGVEERLREAVGKPPLDDPADVARLDRLRARLPGLFDAARSAVFVAESGEGRDAMAGVLAAYDLQAADLESQLIEWRTGRMRVLDLQVRALRDDAAAMIFWARICMAATLLAAAASFALTRRALRRLRRVRDVMQGLAAGDADVSVPEAGGLDEIDDLCRAAEAFKGSTVQAQAQEQALRRTNTLFDGALNNMGHGLIMFDSGGRIEVINRRAYDLYGLDPAAIGPGSTLADLIAHGVSQGNFPGRPTADVLAEMALIAARAKSVSTWSTGGGRMVAVSHERTPEGAWITTHEDVTERRKSEEQLRFLERHDALTGLPNRLQLVERLTERLDAAQADAAALRPPAGFALHCLDVRRLRSVNDTLGHPFGDALLRQAADRLRGLARAGEFAARLEGNRFAVLQDGAQRPEEAIALARRVKRLLAQPYKVAGNDVVVGISMGIALAPSDGAAADVLLRNANLALVRAKSDSPGAWHFFEPGMDARAQARRRLETDLRAALARGEFEVWYQPLIDTGTRRVSGFEALLRWSHPTRGMVGPSEFIPVAEEIGVIVPLGAWVLRTACEEARTWPDHLKLAVNLSSVQFRDPDLVRTVTGALDEADFPAGRLDLEITESVLLQDSEATLATLHELRGLGVRISMDDFGTGYSSLSYLRSFPFDKIKIDKSFVSDLSDRADSLAIVRAVTGLGRSLGMATTAEGVETDAQLARLSSEGCTEVQGFLFSPPRPARELPRLLRELAATAEELAA